MEKIYAYIDESGSYGFDFGKEGNQNLFIVSAIIVKESDILQIEKGTECIRKEEFNGNEIKSNGIKGNHKRRKRVLGKALNLPFHIFALVVDKRVIFSDHGIKRSKKYFYEFLNNLLYKELRAAYPSLSIIADGIGEKEFATEFCKYVESHKKPVTLFDMEDFSVVDSKQNAGVQIADLIAGTLAYIYDEKKNTDPQTKEEFLKMLYCKLLHVKFFPLSYDEQLFEHTEGNNEIDETIFTISYRKAQQFINNNEKTTDEDVKRQLFVLKYLLFRFKYNKFRKYIPTKELMNAMQNACFPRISEQVFRNRVIGKLRDSGVIISSSSKGYKLPTSEKEITDYYQHVSGVVIPMLHRLALCEDTIKVASENHINIIHSENFKGLSIILEAIKRNIYI